MAYPPVHLGHLALSGAALLILEATAVNPVWRISLQDLGLWYDRTEQALAAVVDMVKKHSLIVWGSNWPMLGVKHLLNRPGPAEELLLPTKRAAGKRSRRRRSPMTTPPPRRVR